tara:strand:- start:24 stop:842 length:819 start_codon:yes stop_codon:yes gene_type:complete
MLSIEEIKLLIEKLEKVKKEDLQELIDTNLKILKDIEMAVDASGTEAVENTVNPPSWYRRDLQEKMKAPVVDPWLYRVVQTKIFQFQAISGSSTKGGLYNSLEIGPGNGMFSKEFRSWRINYFLDILEELEKKIRRRFPPLHQKYLKFFRTRKTHCEAMPQGSCNFVFSWDTFVFFSQNHIQHYLHDIKRVIVPGGYCFIQYADCHFDYDLLQAKRGYWQYNTKTAMTKIIEEEGYEVVEMNQFRPGANYAVFRKPGKQNSVTYKVSEITLD